MPANPSASTGVTSNQSQLEEIWRSECLLDAMCDPGRFETHIAVTLARQMMALYQGFDTRLVAELIALPDVGAGKDRRVERCLEILDAVSDSRRMVMPLRRLADSVNPRVRSKVARILGRLSNNLAWTWKFREEKDSRTRANMIESQWGNDSPEIREVLWLAVRDTHQRVRGNAILALYRLGVGSRAG
jgi:HEAT repeat protein